MKILIVDDDPTVVDFFTQASQVSGHSDIDTAGSGEEALARVIQGTYDLITLDIRMPGASGLEILSPVRNMCPHAVIAVISGHVPEDPGGEYAGCADVVIHKPVDLKSFTRLLACAQRIAETMDEIRQLGDGSLAKSQGNNEA